MTETTTQYGCDTSDMRFPHGMLRRALADPETVLGRARPGDREHAAQVSSYYANVLDFLHAHHGAEDELLWPKLRQRAPQHLPLYERMEAEHAGISGACDAAQAADESYGADPTEDTARALAAAIRHLIGELEVHLSEEEREILPIAAVTMTQEEWGEMPGHGMRHMTADKPWLIIGLIFEQMPEDVRSVTLQHFPPPVREMWETSGSSMFSSFIAGIRGTVSTASA
ncbi:MAG: hemerythrin domain-containing protein [Candidatus Dormibacteria bacterium]